MGYRGDVVETWRLLGRGKESDGSIFSVGKSYNVLLLGALGRGESWLADAFGGFAEVEDAWLHKRGSPHSQVHNTTTISCNQTASRPIHIHADTVCTFSGSSSFVYTSPSTNVHGHPTTGPNRTEP
jgi:hypothetical protein